MDVPEPAPETVIRRSPWWFELILLGGAYFLYSWVADRAPRAPALRNGRAILHFERRLHVTLEPHLNHLWTTHGRGLIVFGNLYYDLMHFIVPVSTLVWVYFFRHHIYVRLRTPLVIASLIALAVFWLWPTAPPRLIPELHLYDTIARVHTLGGGGSHGITSSEDPFAALPSLHITWASWACFAVWSATRSRLWRTLLALNVALMAFMVMATGNHWLSDVLAGASAVALSALLSHQLSRWWAARQGSASATPAVPASIDDARR